MTEVLSPPKSECIPVLPTTMKDFYNAASSLLKAKGRPFVFSNLPADFPRKFAPSFAHDVAGFTTGDKTSTSYDKQRVVRIDVIGFLTTQEQYGALTVRMGLEDPNSLIVNNRIYDIAAEFSGEYYKFRFDLPSDEPASDEVERTNVLREDEMRNLTAILSSPFLQPVD